jgi:hypothetical protein
LGAAGPVLWDHNACGGVEDLAQVALPGLKEEGMPPAMGRRGVFHKAAPRPAGARPSREG